jgi:prolyl-tRNA synthetase
MLWSKSFIPTLREAPAGVEDAGARVLIRAGYQRQGGIHLPLSHRSLSRLVELVKAELDGQEMSTPAGVRLAAIGGPRSPKQLPQLWFQVRFPSSIEIVTFELDQDGVDARGRYIEQAFARVLKQCGLLFHVAEGQPGKAREFVVFSDLGATKVAWCEEAGYAATLDFAYAIPKPPLTPDPEGERKPERFHTPNRKTIADLVEFTGEPATSQMKSLVQVCGGKPYLVLVRGDHQLSRPKLAAFVGFDESVPASPAQIVEWFGANPGSLGPVGVTNMPILADLALQGRRNMTCGANEDDYHLRHVTPGEDFPVEFADLRRVEEGDMCPAYPAEITIKTTHSLARVSEGEPFTTVSTFQLEQLLTFAASVHQDADGLMLPRALSPFDIVLTPANFNDEAQRKAAMKLYEECGGLDVLLDDRDERPGVKFKDADLIGIPIRIVIGKKLSEGLVEVVARRVKADVPVAEAAAYARKLLQAELP